MKEPKQLLAWGNTSLLGNAIEQAQNCHAESLFLVLGANASLIRKNINHEKVNVIINPEWSLGLGNSLAFGVQQILKKEKETDAILITLADQPLIDSKYLNELIDVFKRGNKGIIASSYINKAGVPAIFGKSYFLTLSQLEGDLGAGTILNNTKDILTIDAKDKIKDIDTPEDYRALHQAHFGSKI